jgi:hypothetical protein
MVPSRLSEFNREDGIALEDLQIPREVKLASG